jgi:hypothetical protein
MRHLTLALYLCAASAAFCQSSTPAPSKPRAVEPDKLWQLPPGFAPPLMDFGKFPRQWNSLKIVPRTEIVIMKSDRALADARIDRNMIVHPPSGSIGVQPRGTLVAQNLYPDLKMLPIDWPNARVEQIPTSWPSYKLEAIPVEFGAVKALPIQQGNASKVQSPAP